MEIIRRQEAIIKTNDYEPNYHYHISQALLQSNAVIHQCCLTRLTQLECFDQHLESPSDPTIVHGTRIMEQMQWVLYLTDFVLSQTWPHLY